jgi:CBS domain-containing protein
MTEQAILARDMMTKHLVTLSPDLEVFDAIDILLKKRISGAPVVDRQGNFVGIFSESSSMRVIINAAYESLPDAGLMHFIVVDPPTISPDTDLLTICQTFLDQATRRLPVLENGRLLGMVSRRDVMRKVVSMVRGKRCGHAELLYISALLNEGKESVEFRILH